MEQDEKDFSQYVSESDEVEQKVDEIKQAISSITEDSSDSETAEEKEKTIADLDQALEIIKDINGRIDENDDITDEDKLKYVQSCESIEKMYDDFGLGEDESESESNDTDKTEVKVDEVNEDDDLDADDRLESEIRSALGSMTDANKFEPQPTEINPDLTDDEIIALVTKEEEDSILDSGTDDSTPTLTVQKQLSDVLDDLGLGDGTEAIKVVFEQALANRLKRGLEILRKITESKNDKAQAELTNRIVEASKVTLIKWFKDNKTSIVESQIVKSSMEASKIMVNALKEQNYNIELPKRTNLVSKYKSLSESLQSKNEALERENKILIKEQKEVLKVNMINEAKSSITTASDKERFENIAKTLTFESNKSFSSKLDILKKQFITEKSGLAEKFKSQKKLNEQIVAKTEVDSTTKVIQEEDAFIKQIKNSNLF